MEQRTEEWYQARLGKIGASEIGKIINKKKDGSMYQQEEDLLIQKVAERLTGKKTDTYINQLLTTKDMIKKLQATADALQAQIMDQM